MVGVFLGEGVRVRGSVGGGLEVLASSFSPNTFCLIEKSQELNILAGS